MGTWRFETARGNMSIFKEAKIFTGKVKIGSDVVNLYRSGSVSHDCLIDVGDISITVRQSYITSMKQIEVKTFVNGKGLLRFRGHEMRLL